VLSIIDGEKEAKLIASAARRRWRGHARWSLRLLEDKVVELGIVERACDSAKGRSKKSSTQAAPQSPMDHPARG
jgi:hypothetical protein